MKIVESEKTVKSAIYHLNSYYCFLVNTMQYQNILISPNFLVALNKLINITKS